MYYPGVLPPIDEVRGQQITPLLMYYLGVPILNFLTLEYPLYRSLI